MYFSSSPPDAAFTARASQANNTTIPHRLAILLKALAVTGAIGIQCDTRVSSSAHSWSACASTRPRGFRVDWNSWRRAELGLGPLTVAGSEHALAGPSRGAAKLLQIALHSVLEDVLGHERRR